MTRTQALEYRQKIESAAANLSDEDALNSIELFPVWSGKQNYEKGARTRYPRHDSKLYRCYNPVTANPTWTPDVTPAHWEVVTIGEDGTLANPITAAVGMRYYKDLYYIEEDKIYLCNRDDTGDGTILYHLPSQLAGDPLLGAYFVEVTA